VVRCSALIIFQRLIFARQEKGVTRSVFCGILLRRLN
jgi:hypothetical protein